MTCRLEIKPWSDSHEEDGLKDSSRKGEEHVLMEQCEEQVPGNSNYSAGV